MVFLWPVVNEYDLKETITINEPHKCRWFTRLTAVNQQTGGFSEYTEPVIKIKTTILFITSATARNSNPRTASNESYLWYFGGEIFE